MELILVLICGVYILFTYFRFDTHKNRRLLYNITIFAVFNMILAALSASKSGSYMLFWSLNGQALMLISLGWMMIGTISFVGYRFNRGE
ncbi:hypothetical protein SY83_04075 [Paenibacillus swuensis]|uniref:Uncharacterized protein n=1 Tax=Paenibacillus swuensis TaxID=1178515 RepID=A0A172TFD5_9BACL|nr:hypothetical protein [Paenibacillus swuensis]ANE45614.1 hypothetical protein SY83_04075 [Paenibacillus swuensis]